jgi:hypothetical protein
MRARSASQFTGAGLADRQRGPTGPSTAKNGATSARIVASTAGPCMHHDELIRRYLLAAAEHWQEQGRLESRDAVTRANRAADDMRRLADEIARADTAAVRAFGQLLDEPRNGVQTWAAFHVLELMNAPPDVVDHAFEVLETLAEGDGVDALATRMRLKALWSQFGREV